MDHEIVIIIIGLALNFVAMLIGGAGLFFSILRFSVKMESRITMMESNVRQLMRAQHIEPREERDYHV